MKNRLSHFPDALRVMAACTDLTLRGARVRAAHITPQPGILIDEPRLGVVPAYGYIQSPRGCLSSPVWCQARLHGVPVAWVGRGVR